MPDLSFTIPVFKIHLNTLLVICLYYVPFLLCFVGYTVRTAKNYMKDKSNRELSLVDKFKVYYPTDYLGDIMGRAIVSILPIANLWAAMFDIFPNMFGKLCVFFHNIFNQPLVPRKENK